MGQLEPARTSVGDLVTAALREAGALGQGQTPLAEEITEGQTRLQWMLQEWERKRWLVYQLVTLSKVMTGVQSYSIGPDGDFNTNQFDSAFAAPFGQSVRPARIESAYMRLLNTANPDRVDVPLGILKSREDYNRVRLKSLTAFAYGLYYETGWPLGTIYPLPIPAGGGQYEIFVSIMQQLPSQFASAATFISLPYEYYNGIVLNLALRLRPSHGIRTKPGDVLPGLAKDALVTIRTNNAQLPEMTMPPELVRTGGGYYNIFGDFST